MSESFAELFEQSLKVSKIQPGGLLMGEVMRIDNDFVVIDAGLKSEGIIPARAVPRWCGPADRQGR